MATTTAKAVRDRIITVVDSLVPTIHAELPFAAYRDEAGVDFKRWARSHPELCTRRVQVRAVRRQGPAISNTDVELWFYVFEIVVAYAMRWRAGQGFDRDDTIEADFHRIFHAVGMDGRANFTPPTFPDACWVKDMSDVEPIREAIDNVEFLVTKQAYQFYVAVS